MSRRNISQFCNHWECLSSNNNRRHVYNFNDYLHVEQIKNRIAQFFSHIYRRRTYDFVIVNVVKFEIVDKSSYWNEIMNSILALFVYRLQNTQIVYDFLAINDDILYLIETSYESDWQKKNEHYLLKCNWNVIYLWKWKKSFTHDVWLRESSWKRFSFDNRKSLSHRQTSASISWRHWYLNSKHVVKDFSTSM